MKPYYQDDLVTIYHGDCQEWMPAADVVVTDPPYGTGNYLTDTSVLSGPMLLRWPNAAIFGWPEHLARLCIEALREPDDWIVWWPTNAELRRWAGRGQTPREAEHIAIFGEVNWVHGAESSDNSNAILARSFSPRAANGKNRGMVHRSPSGKKWGDVWTDASPGLGFQSGNRLHPNEKPVSLMRRLLQVVADGTVLDPFMGSGSTLVAAKSLNRKAIGIEIKERYCEIAANRCRQEVLGLAL